MTGALQEKNVADLEKPATTAISTSNYSRLEVNNPANAAVLTQAGLFLV